MLVSCGERPAVVGASGSGKAVAPFALPWYFAFPLLSMFLRSMSLRFVYSIRPLAPPGLSAPCRLSIRLVDAEHVLPPSLGGCAADEEFPFGRVEVGEEVLGLERA